MQTVNFKAVLAMLETKFNGMPETKSKDKCKSYKLYVGRFWSLHAELWDNYIQTRRFGAACMRNFEFRLLLRYASRFRAIFERVRS